MNRIIVLFFRSKQSVYYAGTEISNGICMFEHWIIDVFEEYGELPVIFFGNFNARAGDKSDSDGVADCDRLEAIEEL